ncbi:MAG: diphosphate--fructose-6-phosphate 1-phosphotransferase [Chlamydiales bacterium]|nr:diphosphate--fructose-6-phosphate 1-phosphotransferase [Chlamydiales bacterium]
MSIEILSSLQKARLEYKPKVPEVLKHLKMLTLQHLEGFEVKEEISRLFPHLFKDRRITFALGIHNEFNIKKVGVVFSGGQAPGGHNVITGIYDALQELNSEGVLYGFLGGPSGIINNQYKELNAQSLALYRNQGGFDLIGSGRAKIETDIQLKTTLDNVVKLQLDGLIIIGGDDSNTNAAVLAEYFKKQSCKTCVIGVPKTIDGDLKNAFVETSFGFDTACKVYSEGIGNIQRDALSAKKYTHFIRLMGRSASNIALECALQTQPNLTIIGEEVAEEKKTLKQITDEIADLVVARSVAGKNYGTILIPEGLIEFIPEVKSLIQELNISSNLTPSASVCFQLFPKNIQEQLLKERDPHGNLQVALIETEKLFIALVSEELKKRAIEGSFSGVFTPQAHFFGYEGRAALPSNFDSDYCYSLGRLALLLVSNHLSGYMCAIQNLKENSLNWQVGAIPLVPLLVMEVRNGKKRPVIQKALVDLKGKAFNQFASHRKKWQVNDAYKSPGPIQFFGPEDLTDERVLSL